jgi:hypothetical protein
MLRNPITYTLLLTFACRGGNAFTSTTDDGLKPSVELTTSGLDSMSTGGRGSATGGSSGMATGGQPPNLAHLWLLFAIH